MVYFSKKLQICSIRGAPLKLIESYLSDKKQYVNILSDISDLLGDVVGQIFDRLFVIFGNPQGSCWVPLFSNLH